MKPVYWRPAAEADATLAAEWYGQQAGLAAGQRFLEGLETGLLYLSRHPSAGATRYASLVQIEGLRYWPLKTFPYLIFYMEREDRIDVWRILHAQRDIPVWISQNE